MDVSVIPIKLDESTEVVELFTYDVGGQDVFIDCCEEHLHDANYVVLVFNLFDEKSFSECRDWLNLVLKSRKQTADPPCGLLVGNKTDLNLTTKVDQSAIDRWAASNMFKYFEVSAVSTPPHIFSSWFQALFSPLSRHASNAPSLLLSIRQVPHETSWKEPFHFIAKDCKLKYEEFVEKAKNVRMQ